MESFGQPLSISLPSGWTRLHGIIVMAALAITVGSFLPWATVEVFGVSINKAGTSGDGKLTLALGVATFALLGVKKWGVILAFVVMLVASCIALYDITDTTRRIGEINGMSSAVDASIGIGLWMVTIGSLCGLLATSALAREQRALSRQSFE